VHHLITGGAGFIGSHLAQYLLGQGEEVTVLDDLSSGRVENVEPFRSHAGFKYVAGSARDDALLAQLVPKAHVVHHLAASVGLFLLLERPVYVMENNVEGARAVLRAADAAGCKVVFASSSEVYGDLNSDAFHESDPLVLPPPTNPRWAYSYSKAVGESLALCYAHERHMPVTIVRFFNIIGPRQSGRHGHVVPRLVSQALNGQPLTVFGDGQQTRCFASVGEIARAIARLACDERANGEIFNIGSDREISMLELAERIRRLAGSASPIERVPYAEAYAPDFVDVRRRVPDLTKLETILGYRPPIDLDAVLREIIDSARQTKHPILQ